MGDVALLATRNAGKLRELLPLLRDAGLRAETLFDVGIPESGEEDALESFDTFEENALAKAQWFSARSGGRIVFADDSGLVVAALGGRPGVQSKRWAGHAALGGAELDAANNCHLLAELERTGASTAGERLAQYVCAAACAWPGGALVVRGSTGGRILSAPKGVGGFGYDPYFWSDELGSSFAVVSRSAKEGVSHRGRAFRRLFAELQSISVAPKLFGPVDPGGVPG